LEIPGHVHRPALVAVVALDLPGDGGNGERGERAAAGHVVAVDGVDEADAGDLEDVVERLAGADVALGEAARQGQEALDEELAVGRGAFVGEALEERDPLAAAARRSLVRCAASRSGRSSMPRLQVVALRRSTAPPLASSAET